MNNILFCKLLLLYKRYALQVHELFQKLQLLLTLRPNIWLILTCIRTRLCPAFLSWRAWKHLKVSLHNFFFFPLVGSQSVYRPHRRVNFCKKKKSADILTVPFLLTRRPKIWLMAADSLSVHSATTCALISFMKSMKALSGFFMWFFFFSSGGWWPVLGPPPPYWSKELFLQCIKVSFTILPH